MRWFKHLTRAHLDEALSSLQAQAGHEGYGFFWWLCEVIAESMDKTDRCELSHPLAQWSRLLCCHHHRVIKYLGLLNSLGLINVSQVLPSGYPPVTTPSNRQVTKRSTSDDWGGNISVSIPNLLKYRDEWSSRQPNCSGEHAEVLGCKDRDREYRERTPPTPPPEFGLTEPPPNGNGTPKSKPPDPDVAMVEPFVTAIHDRHPAVRRCGPAEVRQHLLAIIRGVPRAARYALLETIDRNHIGWCDTVDWTKEGGQYAKGLDGWLAPTKRRWEVPPPIFAEQTPYPRKLML